MKADKGRKRGERDRGKKIRTKRKKQRNSLYYSYERYIHRQISIRRIIVFLTRRDPGSPSI